MLMGVTWDPVDVKQHGALARGNWNVVRPLAALFQRPRTTGPAVRTGLAEMIRDSAHDSICACSVDDVVDAVLHRYTEARAIAAGLPDRAVEHSPARSHRPARRC